MRALYLILFVLAASCSKESELPKLSFSSEERQWFIYQKNQTFTFKNSSGDTVSFKVASVQNNYTTEYKNPFTQSVAVAITEYYSVKLESPKDSIIIYFYKEYLYNSDPNKLRHTIRWHGVQGQFVELDAIENKSAFTNKTVNGKTYSKVTKASPLSQTSYPWAIWEEASYDQNNGFIELVDVKGDIWVRK